MTFRSFWNRAVHTRNIERALEGSRDPTLHHLRMHVRNILRATTPEHRKLAQERLETFTETPMEVIPLTERGMDKLKPGDTFPVYLAAPHHNETVVNIGTYQYPTFEFIYQEPRHDRNLARRLRDVLGV